MSYHTEKGKCACSACLFMLRTWPEPRQILVSRHDDPLSWLVGDAGNTDSLIAWEGLPATLRLKAWRLMRPVARESLLRMAIERRDRLTNKTVGYKGKILVTTRKENVFMINLRKLMSFCFLIVSIAAMVAIVLYYSVYTAIHLFMVTS